MADETAARRAAGHDPDRGPARTGTAGPGGATAVAAGDASPPPRTTRPSWVVAAATFVIGLLLGAAVTAVAGGAGPADAPAATTGPVATPAAPVAPLPGDGAVVVPGACLDVADRADELAALVRDAAAAAGELDAAALSAIVRELEGSQAGLEAETTRCRAGEPVP